MSFSFRWYVLAFSTTLSKLEDYKLKVVFFFLQKIRFEISFEILSLIFCDKHET